MADKEQVKPLAPTSYRISIDDEKALPGGLKKHHHRRWIKCCGCISALILILAVVILVLVFTVFHIKDPILNLNSVKIEGWSHVMWTNLKPGMNLTVKADVSVKNPNSASFKYNYATTSLYYDGRIIGEARTPPGHARARRTIRLNVTFDAMLEKIMGVPRLGNDLLSGTIPLTSYTKISGVVNIFKVMKRGVVVKMNCTMTIRLASQEIEDQDCKHGFSV